MQAQATRTTTQAITSIQSLAAVQTLLRVGLGCITYLRDLLPEENFTRTHLVTEDDASFSSQGSESGSFSSLTARPSRNGKGFQVMTMTRGYSDEADKILNYLETGIFHALSKQYLRSFIFAIYLDSKDPNNIVEAYTFNFQYHTLPESGVVVPIMTLGDDLQRMSLKDKRNMQDDPVATASRAGKPPTLLDVKKSVKVLLKTLINAITQMEQLPKRRYATFKLFYTDNTPADYEPPHFQAGDVEKDKWFFMTHGVDESPDKLNVGKVDTGHHCVNLSVTSIASYLPSSQNNNATFVGTASQLPKQNLSPMQEAALRAQQAEEQEKDAMDRNIAWSVEEAVELADADAEGEEDPDYALQPDGTYALKEGDNLAPVGMRNDDGEIVPLPEPMEVDEAQFSGENEQVPTKINELNKHAEKSNLTQTQELGGFTQIDSESDDDIDTPCPEGRRLTRNARTSSSTLRSSPMSPSISPLPPSDDFEDPLEEIDETMETLNLETQIESQIETPEGDLTPRATTPTPRPRDAVMKEASGIDIGLKCSCEIDSEEQPHCFCEGGCGRWYHVWCIGYHSAKDPRLPEQYICFDCRVRADKTWELINGSIYATLYSRYQDLALFRRAIKTMEYSKPETFAEFSKAHGSRNALARQLFKRLETEGFLIEQITTMNELGFPEIRSKATKTTKGKGAKTKKNAQKPTYRFNREMIKSQEYLDYFNPDPKLENRLLGLTELVSSKRDIPQKGVGRKAPAHANLYEDETQPETQALEKKRTGSSPDLERPRKKVKISVTHGLDLAE